MAAHFSTGKVTVMTDDSDLAMASVRRVQAGLRALADGDQAAALATVNHASEAERTWMIASLYGVADTVVGVVSQGDTVRKARLLRSFADGMESDVAATGAEVVVADWLRREHPDG